MRTVTFASRRSLPDRQRSHFPPGLLRRLRDPDALDSGDDDHDGGHLSCWGASQRGIYQTWQQHTLECILFEGLFFKLFCLFATSGKCHFGYLAL